MQSIRFVLSLFIVQFASLAWCAEAPKITVDSVLQAYVRALGGQAVLELINTRQIEAKVHHVGKVTYYWAKPDKVLRLSHGEKTGFDGASGWVLSRKKKLTRLPKPEQQDLEINANPVRYAHLKELYSDLAAGLPEHVDDRHMDVLIAPNNIGSTKFYFDSVSHLLVRIEDFGIQSAYYKHITEFFDYKNVDGIQFPFRILHTTTEPGEKTEDIRIISVEQNVELKPEVFTKPRIGAVTLGGKR